MPSVPKTRDTNEAENTMLISHMMGKGYRKITAKTASTIRNTFIIFSFVV